MRSSCSADPTFSISLYVSRNAAIVSAFLAGLTRVPTFSKKNDKFPPPISAGSGLLTLYLCVFLPPPPSPRGNPGGHIYKDF
jgi:hypothetical protein